MKGRVLKNMAWAFEKPVVSKSAHIIQIPSDYTLYVWQHQIVASLVIPTSNAAVAS